MRLEDAVPRTLRHQGRVAALDDGCGAYHHGFRQTIGALTVRAKRRLRLPCEIFVPLTWEMGLTLRSSGRGHPPKSCGHGGLRAHLTATFEYEDAIEG